MPKISALHTIEYLTTGSVLPVVDNGETQKVTLQKVVEFVSASLEPTFATDIELLRSASAITSSLNTFASASVLSVATKLSTASFEAYTASVSFASVNTSSLLLSSSFNTFTSSYKTDSGSFDNRIDNLELINVNPFLSASTFNTFTSSVNTLSSSFDQRIRNATNEQILDGFVVTSSFNNYTSSQTTLNNTFATTGSNVFKGNQTISGSLDVLIPGGTATGMNENPTSNNIFWSYPSQDTNTANVEIGWDAVAEGLGNYIVTDVQFDTPYAPFISITLNDDVALPYRVRLNFSKPSHLWQFNEDGEIVFPDNTLQTTAFTGIPTGSISSSQQITDLGFATTGSNTFTDEQIAPSFTADQITANDAAYLRRIDNIGNANIDVLSNISSSHLIYARQFIGDGRYLTNLTATTNWNYNQEYEVKKTEQLTFSGDYILDNTYLFVEGGVPNSIGDWTFETWDTNGTYTPTGSNGYVITGPTGDTNASIGIWMHRQFDTPTTMSIDYVWNGTDVGNDWPIYAVDTQYPYEINTENRLQDINAVSESGTWTINVSSGSWLSIGVNTANVNNTVGTLQITLPYLSNSDNVKYSSNKYFKKEGKIFIGGNLLVKDSYIENNGQISVGGEVILIGNSQIAGTGTII
jgi:hypothetical protein